MKHSRKAALAAGLGCVALLCCTQSRAEREDRKLMAKEWRKGGLEELQAMTAKDVKSMQVFNLTRQNKKEYREHAVTTARNAPQIEAFLRFLKTSKQCFIPHGVPLCPSPPDRVLVIEPATGAPFEFAYSDYPLYHSKYNPIERVFGVLENYWNGDPLTSVDKALGMARGMTYKGIHPTAVLIERAYPKGVRLDKKTMKPYEKCPDRLKGLGKWFISISPVTAAATLSLMTI